MPSERTHIGVWVLPIAVDPSGSGLDARRGSGREGIQRQQRQQRQQRAAAGCTEGTPPCGQPAPHARGRPRQAARGPGRAPRRAAATEATEGAD